MPKTIEITMTPRGFEVTSGGRTASFATLEDAVGFARARFELAQEIREMVANLD